MGGRSQSAIYTVGAVFGDVSTNSDQRCHRLTLKIGGVVSTRGLRSSRGEQCPHGLSRQRNNREDTKNCSERNEETFDTSHYQRKGVMLVAGQAATGKQNTNRHRDPD